MRAHCIFAVLLWLSGECLCNVSAARGLLRLMGKKQLELQDQKSESCVLDDGGLCFCVLKMCIVNFVCRYLCVCLFCCVL